MVSLAMLPGNGNAILALAVLGLKVKLRERLDKAPRLGAAVRVAINRIYRPCQAPCHAASVVSGIFTLRRDRRVTVIREILILHVASMIPGLQCTWPTHGGVGSERIPRCVVVHKLNDRERSRETSIPAKILWQTLLAVAGGTNTGVVTKLIVAEPITKGSNICRPVKSIHIEGVWRPRSKTVRGGMTGHAEGRSLVARRVSHLLRHGYCVSSARRLPAV